LIKFRFLVQQGRLGTLINVKFSVKEPTPNFLFIVLELSMWALGKYWSTVLELRIQSFQDLRVALYASFICIIS